MSRQYSDPQLHDSPPSERLQTLAEISRVVSATLDLATLYDTIYQQVGRVMDTTRFFIALHRPERGVFEIPYHREDNELFVDQEVPLGNSVTSHVVTHGTALLFNSEDGYARFAEDNDLPQLYLGEEGSQSMIFVPLNTEEGTIGALTVQSTEPNIYTSDDVRTLSVIASQAAVAIENARLFAAERDRVTELQTIQSLVHTLIGLHLVPDIAAAIDLELRRLIEYHACRLFMIDEESKNLVLLTGSADAPTLQLGEGIAGWIAQHGVSVVIPNTLEDPRLKYIEGTPVREESMIGVPLVYEGRVRGVMTLTKLGINQFDSNAVRLLEIVAGQAAIVFDRARLYDQLRTDAITDPLTKLYNRRHLMDRFAEERNRANRSGHVLAAIMIDIDKFKRINDTFGHDAGDVVLDIVAAAIRKVVRAEDIVARLGGEEFCVLLPETSDRGVERAAERIRVVIAAAPMPSGVGLDGITVSVGVATLQEDDRSTEIFTRADAALYQAKHSGGNAVCVADADGVHFLPGQERPERIPAVGTVPVWLGQQHVDTVLDGLSYVAAALDLKGRIVYGNPALFALTGYSVEEVIGREWSDIFVPVPVGEESSQESDLLGDDDGRGVYQTTLRTKEGIDLRMSWSTVVLFDGKRQPAGTLSIGEDISEMTSPGPLAEGQLHDALTGLPNRTLFHDRLRQTLLAVDRDKQPAAVLLMDINRFKEINDTMGHAHGDLTLQQVAAGLRSTIRESDTVARLGSDEFAMVFPGSDREGAARVARKLLRLLEQPVLVDGRSYDVDASVGIALFPQHGSDSATLLRRAEIAMYSAKRNSDGWAVFNPEQDHNDTPRLMLTGQLRRALAHNQLELHYQPKVDLRSGVMLGAEALIRWRHPEQGLLQPASFIPLAEHTGLIKPLGLWVMNAALLQARLWQDAGRCFHIAVNLSARHLHDADLVPAITELLNVWEAEPQWLALEITESAVMADPDKAISILSTLNAMGVRISIDDFGTGYSSLSYLKQLPVQELKIDRSFVSDMATSDNDAFIVQSIIDLGHNLGIQVVAEGVENLEIVQRLTELGCDLAQGFYYGRPMHPSEITSWIQPADIGA